MRVNSAILLMASSQSSSATVSFTPVTMNASPLRGAPSEIARLAILQVRPGNNTERVTLILDSLGERSQLLVPITMESLTASSGYDDLSDDFESPFEETSVVFGLRNSWVGQPDLILEDSNVLTQKFLPSEETENLETYGTLAIGPASAFAQQFKSFVLSPFTLGPVNDTRIVKNLVLLPVNPGCDCAGPDYRMKTATAIRVPGIGFTTPDVWAVMGSTRFASSSSTTFSSPQARYHISTASNEDHIPAAIYDALVANITAQGASISSSESDDMVPISIISNCDSVKNWPQIAYSITLDDPESTSDVFDLVIDESDYLEPVRSSSSCILRLQPNRQRYSKPIEDFTIGVNILNKYAIHFDNVNRQVGFCKSRQVRV